MTNLTIPQTVRFPDLFDKPLMATFDREQASSDGGAVLLKAAERVYGLVKAFARCLVDKRAPEKIRDTLEDLVGQRVFGIACGHPDGNDADHLADDPIHKLLLGRDPVAGGRLASQPTISRFENDAGCSSGTETVHVRTTSSRAGNGAGFTPISGSPQIGVGGFGAVRRRRQQRPMTDERLRTEVDLQLAAEGRAVAGCGVGAR